MLRKHLLLVLILLTYFIGYAQNKKQVLQQDTWAFTQIKTDTIFNSNQIISLLTIPKSSLDEYNIEINYRNSELKTTSSFAEDGNAIAAINGSFFDMKKGGSVTYLEITDSVITRSLSPELKSNTFDNIIDGAVILAKDNTIRLEYAQPDKFYEQSKKESAVLGTGPVLLLNSTPVKLADIKFVNNRHPRTCMCLKKKAVVLITIDGRQDEAEGMSLPEVQTFLQNIKCIDAINLDGGGSTTMWIKDSGIVNFPSDKTGERAVANVILVTEN
ncbi:MAG: phosphodiester glycosidase family protein [Bacteroidota bacterium]